MVERAAFDSLRISEGHGTDEFRYRVKRAGRSPGAWSKWLPFDGYEMVFPKAVSIAVGDRLDTEVRWSA